MNKPNAGPVAGSTAATIDDYIATFPAHVQPRLEKLRQTIRSAVPQATEAISYRIPTFKLDGGYLIYFAGFNTHIGLYPVQTNSAGFDARLAQYASGKATLKFPLDEPLPYELIAKLVKAKAKAQRSAKSLAKAKPHKKMPAVSKVRKADK